MLQSPVGFVRKHKSIFLLQLNATYNIISVGHGPSTFVNPEYNGVLMEHFNTVS